MTTQPDEPVHSCEQNAGPSSALTRAVAEALFDAPCGALTLLNGQRLETVGGWAALAAVLDEVTTEAERDVFHCKFGDAGAHPLTEHLAQLDGEFLTDVSDTDDDLWVRAPDWCSDEYDAFDPDPLADRLSAFGSASLPRLARILAAENHMSGALPLLLIDAVSARPYAGILRRLHDGARDRDGRGPAAVTMTSLVYEWLANDLAIFAAHRPNAATIVVSDARSPEWNAFTSQSAHVTLDAHSAYLTG